ncbi:MAG: MBL fold metallo-hydrolase [Solirubrobacteraceae bacterium]
MSGPAREATGAGAGAGAKVAEGQAQRAAAQEALRRAGEAGIHRLSIPTPFPVGRVNAYLIEGEPLTLVDSGPNSAKALYELELALAELGHRIEDLELLVMTHGHADHIGLAEVLQRRSGAEVAALAQLGHYVSNLRQEGAADTRFIERMMRENGVPGDVARALRSTSAGITAWGSTVKVDHALADGDELRVGGATVRALHRPGHSPCDTVFVEGQHALMLAGDHLLAHISSNPLVSRPMGARGDYEGAREPALVSYIESMSRTRELELEIVLPGHGEPITDHRALIDARLALHERRAQRIHGLLSEKPLSAHEIAHAMWSELALTQAYLTISEVLGHVDLLIADGRASEEIEGGVARFRAH